MLAITSARFVRCRGAGWLAQQSDSDYARERLGVGRSTFDTWVRVGTLTLQVPETARGVTSGALTNSALAELARLRDATAVRELLPLAYGASVRDVRALVDAALSTAQPGRLAGAAADNAAACAGAEGAQSNPLNADADCQRQAIRLDPESTDVLARWTVRVPAPVAAYLHQTLGIAQLLLGHDTPRHEQLAAVVAEASTELDITVPAVEACRRLGIDLAPTAAPGHTQRPAATMTAAMTAEAAAATSAPRTATLASGPLPKLSDARLRVWRSAAGGSLRSRASMWKLARDHPSRALAHRLDRRLQRLVRQRQAQHTQLEDELLALLEADAPRRLGYSSFEQFAEAALGMPPRTAWNRVARARQRRRGDPVAVAMQQGRLTSSHAAELERLIRQAFVPRSAVTSWIEDATQVTVRRLRRKVDWGIGRFYRDCRSWSLRGYPLPSDDELRTSGRAILQAAAEPEPPDEAALHHARTLRHIPVPLEADLEVLAVLAQLICSLQDQAQRRRRRETGGPGPQPQPWWGLLVILRLARDAWADVAQGNTHDTHRVLERDAYQCAAPGCSRRRDLQAHHIRYRSDQGSDDLDNLATLCSFHHQLGEHGGILHVHGTAHPDAGSLFWAMGIDEHGRARQLYRGDRLLGHDSPDWQDAT